MDPVQIIIFLILAAALVYGMYKFRNYLAKKDAAHHAAAHPSIAPEGPAAAGENSGQDHPKQA